MGGVGIFHMLLRRFLSRSLHQPWFVDPLAEPGRPTPPHLPSPPPLPDNVPQPLKALHAQLSTSLLLEPATLDVCQPTSFPPGPALPASIPKGRRLRGRTYAGEGILSGHGDSIWNWILLAQVKNGLENRGAIESVERLVRRTLLTMQPPLPVPRRPRQRLHNGWAMVDAGDFAVHILSLAVREKYFVRRDW